MKKLRKIGLWAAIIAYFILITGFVAGRRQDTLCNKVSITIADSLSKRFIDKTDIITLLDNNKKLSLGNSIEEINTHQIEHLILSNSLVKKCKVYTTINGKLNIELEQREPVVRIIDKNNKSYYLDVEGSIIGPSKRFTPHLLVVNGNINTPFNPEKVENIYDRNFDNKAKTLREIHKMALYIASDKFWEAQIVQLYVDKKGEYELIPRIGPHIIQLGTYEHFEDKFEKLWIFYNEGLKNVGWNKYLKIDLKYKDQIVCSKI